jgi:secreted trypsin-like serine protease
MSDAYFDSTVEWYQNWLAEKRPDLSEEQRNELAVGFVTAQQPPKRVVDEEDDDEVMPDGMSVEEARAEQRKRIRLTDAELSAILSDPK